MIPGYVLLDTSSAEGGLCLMDHRAAHSRVIFEKLKRENESQPLAIQSLLVPYTLALTPQEASALHLVIDNLNQLGIHIKEFGKSTFIIDAIPAPFGKIDISAFARSLIETLLNDPHMDFQSEIEKRIALMASRVSMSSQSKLSLHEAQSLTQQLFRCHHPYLCPFGKPTIVTINKDELAKYFQCPR